MDTVESIKRNYKMVLLVLKMYFETKLNCLVFGLIVAVRMNTFFYGCSYREDPVKAKIFPFMMSKKTDSISFND